MNRKIVFVRGADGELHRFALLEVSKCAAFVCREETYDEIVRGAKRAPGIGFPIGDVFEATAELPYGERPSPQHLKSLDSCDL